MDFDKFIERDALEFLDKQAMLIAEKAAGLREEEFELYEITKDYSKEIDDALKEGDLKKTQKIFDDIKTKYMKAQDNSLGKKRLYTIMEEIYEKIKDYESKEEGKKNLFETMKEYEEKGLFTTPELLSGKETDNGDLLLRAVAEIEKKLETITSKKPITGADLEQTIKLYREMKKLIQKIPQSRQKEKASAYDTALSWYYTIKKLAEKLADEAEAKEKAEAAPEHKADEEKLINQKLEDIRRLKEEIVESHKKVSEFIKKKEFRNCVVEYRQLRKLIEEFPAEMEGEKAALLADALSLYESIKKLKRSLEEKREEEMREAQKNQKDLEDRKRIKDDLLKKLGGIKTLLAQKDVVKAMVEYKAVKNLFTSYPDQPLEEKKQLYDQILSTHKDIRILETDFKKTHEPSYEKDVANLDHDVKKIHSLLDSGKSEEATQLLLEAKHRLQMLPNEAFDSKYRLLKEVEIIEHKLLFVKNVQRMNHPGYEIYAVQQ